MRRRELSSAACTPAASLRLSCSEKRGSGSARYVVFCALEVILVFSLYCFSCSRHRHHHHMNASTHNHLPTTLPRRSFLFSWNTWPVDMLGKRRQDKDSRSALMTPFAANLGFTGAGMAEHKMWGGILPTGSPGELEEVAEKFLRMNRALPWGIYRRPWTCGMSVSKWAGWQARRCWRSRFDGGLN